MNRPEGIACNENIVVVADTGNGRLVFYTREGGEARGGKEIKLPQIVYPTRVAINSKGDIYVLDGRLRKVARISPDGAFQAFVETSDLTTQSMIVPAGISLDREDNLYVLDLLGGEVLVINPDGKFLRRIDFPKEYGFITDLTVDPQGTVFVVDGAKSIVYSNAKDQAVFSPITGTLKDDLKFPSNIITDKRGRLFISDQNSGGVVVVGEDGTLQNRIFSLGWKEGTVRYPAQLCIDNKGNVFVADRDNSRIQEFTPLK
ncbi:MAG TPA: NHL repeat-containing protein [Nitrospirota bacterium]|nr:NHL repeat-containing protein [Nitrospirota bacterium]